MPLYSLPVYYAATADLVFKAYPDEMPRFWEMTLEMTRITAPGGRGDIPCPPSS